MEGSLFRRFVYGNQIIPKPFTIENEILVESPRRWKELISIGHEQNAALRRVTKTFTQSHQNASEIGQRAVEMISRELRMQAENLEAAMGMIDFSVKESADAVVEKIDQLESCLSAHLSEIKWHLWQSEKLLHGILEVLCESRANEARQLVNQGVRLYDNGQFDKAEERFRLALQADVTDYRVLRYLGYIELRRDNGESAIKYFQDAIHLPSQLSNTDKAETLDEIARVYYMQGEYEKAHTTITKALRLIPERDAKRVYAAARYSNLSGNISNALILLEEAIVLDHKYFLQSELNEDFANIRVDVTKLLARLSIDAEEKARIDSDSLKREVDQISAESSTYAGYVKSIKEIMTQATNILETPSYSKCFLLVSKLEALFPVVEDIKNLCHLDSSRTKENRALALILDEPHRLKEPLKPDTANLSASMHLLALFLFYVITGYVFASLGPYNYGPKGAPTPEPVIGWWVNFLLWPIFWPLYTLAAVVVGLITIIFPSFADPRTGLGVLPGFLGMAISGIIWLILWKVASELNNNRLVMYTRAIEEFNNTIQEKRDIESRIGILTKEIDNLDQRIKSLLSTIHL